MPAHIMSLKNNILASYASQIYVTLIGIVMVPLYIKYMGAETYGLVGFFAMLQAWFMLLDMGLTPTMVRETASFRGGRNDVLTFRRLVRALEGVFVIVALVGATAMFAASSYIAHDWLQESQLPKGEVQAAIQLMSIIIALRWMCGLYRGVIGGSERLIWLGGCNSIIATLRFIGVLPLLMIVGATPTIFFCFQSAVALLELAVLLFFAYRLLPDVPQGQQLPWDWIPLKAAFKFSLTIAFTSSVMVLVTQTDKLILSKMLLLRDYGYYTLAVMVASGVMMISGPVSNALMPRMAKLQAEGNEADFYYLYHQATQVVAIIAIPTCLVFAFFSELGLWAWTGDTVAASQAAPVLRLYALGNGLLVLDAFPYYLQYAKGDLKLHVIGNILFLLLLIPTLTYAAWAYGAIGAAYAWLAINALTFIAWVPIVHRRFSVGLHLQWLKNNLLQTFLFSILAVIITRILLPQPTDRFSAFWVLVAASIFTIAFGALGSPLVRAIAKKKWMQLERLANRRLFRT